MINKLIIFKIMEWVLSIRTPLLTSFFQIITWFGYKDFLFLFIPLCYWLLDRKIFGIFPLFIFISALINSFLKEFLQDPRPDNIFNIDPWLQGMDASYGFPSGHAQLAVVIWGFLFLRTQNNFLKSIFLFLIITISLSRLYLGVHDLMDIIGGLLIGVISILLLEQLLGSKGKWIRDLGRSKHLFIYILLLFIFFIFWPEHDDKSTLLGLCGISIGFWIGRDIDNTYIRYEAPSKIYLNILSSILALIGFIFVNERVEQIFELVQMHESIEIFISSFLMGTYISIIAPSILYFLRLQSIQKS